MSIKAFLIMCSILACIFVFLVYKGCSNMSEFHEERFSLSIGKYEFSFKGSRIGKDIEDTIFYKNMRLELKKDSTFVFSKKTIYDDSIGVWQIEGYAEESVIRLYFSNGVPRNMSQCISKCNTDIGMNEPNSVKGESIKSGYLRFVRID
jgi:hypothetical protein